MATIFGLEKDLIKRTHLSVTRMEDLFKMEGATGPQDNAPGDMSDMGPPPEPGPSYTSVHIADGEYSEKTSKSANVYGGKTDGSLGKDMRIVTYAPDVGGVFVEGSASSYTLENSAISISGGGMGLGGMISGAASGRGGSLTLKDVIITTSGGSRCATAADDFGVLRVYDSTLIAQGGPFGDDAPADRAMPGGPPAPLEISGNCRTHCTTTNGQSYFYNSTIIGDGWAALSTDASDGYVYLEANDCVVKTLKSGYGAYADVFCHDIFNGCLFDVASMAGILAGECDMVFNDCEVKCGTYFAFIHCIGGPPTQVATLKVSGGKIDCQSDALSIRSHNAIIELDGAEINAGTGVLMRSFINTDAHSCKVRGKKVFGIRATLSNMDAAGDIIHEDTERDMFVDLVSTNLKGAVQNAHLSIDMGSRWYATADSSVTITSDVEINQFDAPAGVTITVKAKNDGGEFDLHSGGRLQITDNR